MAPVAHAGRVDARAVLLTDDDEDFRVALAEGLDADGYDVVAVPNGDAVLAALELGPSASEIRSELRKWARGGPGTTKRV